MQHMTSPLSESVAGSVGVVETQFLDLPEPLSLDCGVWPASSPDRLRDVRHFSPPARDNVILVCHALSGDAPRRRLQ